MGSSWRIFLVTEMLLLIWAIYLILGNVPMVILLLFAFINLVYAIKKRRKTSFNQFQKYASLIVLALCLFSVPVTWIMLVFAVLFIGLKGVEVSGIELFRDVPWKKKQMKMIKTIPSDAKSGRRFKRAWIGNERFGSDTYEWNDINITVFSGDTIIDLGNTLLPKEDNVILIRKGFGKTRIIVPFGIGIMLEHTSLFGEVVFENEHYQLKNESIKIFSEEYDLSNRRLKIVTNTLLGDIEVLRV